MQKRKYYDVVIGSILFVLIIIFIFLLQSCGDDTTGNDNITAPSNLAVVNNNPSNFEISWKDNSDDETGFSIERKKDAGSFTEIATVGADVTEYTDTIAEAGVYSFRVRAVKNGEYSDYSNTVSETIEAPNEHSSNITSDETWAAGIHIVEGYVYVSNGAVLTIEAGAIIKFGTNAGLIIQTNSGLIADGTTGTITFTGEAEQKGYWRFIDFNDDATAVNCKLINCVIEYGGGYSGSSAELIIGNDATVHNCTIRNSSSNGVSIEAGANPDFTGNTITLNNAGPIIAEFTNASSIGTGNYTGNANDFIDLDNGTLKENKTFLKQDVPYRLNDYSYVDNATLTIQAGSRFLMNSEAGMYIGTNGGLMAEGTENDSITFTGYAEQKGYWRFIQLQEDAIPANCHLDYCIIEYGGGYSNSSASLIIRNDATVTNSNIRNSDSYGAVISENANPTFNNNTITMNNLSPIYGDFQSMTYIGYGDYDGNTNDYIDLSSGTISEAGTLKKQNVPYRLNGYNYIEDATLTIEAGTVVFFNQDAGIYVTTNGGMMAQGTIDDSVYFTSNVAQNGYWRFIKFEDVAKDAECIMDYCQIEYGGGYSSNSGSLIVDNNASVTNSTIRYSEAFGLLISDENADPEIDGNTFTLNTKSPIRAEFENIGSIGYGDYSGNNADFLDIGSGTLSKDITLKKQNVPYRLSGYAYVDNAILTIEPGTDIMMNNDAGLIIDENGGLIADGTSETITFTGYSATNGYWRFIQFLPDAIDASCKVKNCVLEYGGGYGNSSGILDIRNVPDITGNTIRHSSSYGIVYKMDAGAHGDYASDNFFNDNKAGNVYGY